jgi:DNA-binding transcriptional LysR family regulator
MRLGQVDLNLLVVLDALLAEKNVTRAAERLHMSQPAASSALARLRRVLGDELLSKRGRYLELTPRARSLIEPVREVLATIQQDIIQPPVFDPTVDDRTFTVIASDYISVVLLRPLIGRLSGLAAGLRLDATSVGSHYVAALRRDEVDIAILPDRIAREQDLSGCSRLAVMTDRFVGAVWSQHPRAGDSLDAALLASSPYLMYMVEGRRAIVEEDLDEAGYSRHVVASASGFLTMPFMLAGTELVAVLPERMARRVAAAADIRILEPDLALRPLHQSAYWHTRRDRDPGHAWFREQLRSQAGAVGR